MRSARHPGPPSTVSGSSGHGLVYGTHRPRSQPMAFTPESSDMAPAKKKTKIIVILGIALPVLACVIGIAAWAVTTDVLRITPRASDNSYNRFGHQGKTRIDNLQSRSDTDVDVFVLHGITPPTLPSPTAQVKSTKKMLSSTMSSTSTTGAATTSTIQTMTSPRASDILSKLISDMPVPKHPKNFIVFAPVADTENVETQRKGRRFDDKVVLHGDDLIAEESIVSEDTSQELSRDKLPFKRKRKPPVESMYTLKPGMRPPQHKKGNQNGKLNRNPRILPSDTISESPPNLIKRPHRGEFVTFPTNSKPPMNVISNRNGGITQSRPNENFPQRNIFPSNSRQNSKSGLENFDKIKIGPEHQISQNTQTFGMRKSRNNLNPSFQSSAFQTSASPNYKPHISHSFPNEETFSSPSQNQFSMQNTEPPNKYLKDNQRPFQSQKQTGFNFNHQQSGSNLNQQHSGSNINQQHTGSNQQTSLQSSQSNFPNLNQQHSGSNINQQHSGPNQQTSLQSSQSNFPNLPHNIHSPDTSSVGSGGPQYFAPPPQTFHTKINYDNPPLKIPPSSISTYEKVAQSSVDPAPDGMHHHHHHHHHHEPVASNSDPIGDVNYSDVPRMNDADRLGTIGIGMGPSRGITLQIGGGGLGGGLGGLLPLGTLGIARNIVSALLPRPQMGLNSKVFLGVEVGRGRGLSMG